MPDWGQISAPSQLKNQQKLPKMGFITPNFLVLHFGQIFKKILTKKPKLQMHAKKQKNVNENTFHSHFYAIFHEFLW